MASYAADMASYLYSKDEDPAGAFSWWLSPCGGESDLVPDEIRQIFDILSLSPGRSKNWKTPKSLKRGSGRKGDQGNPRAPQVTRATRTRTATRTNQRTGCTIPPALSTTRVGIPKRTVRVITCDNQGATVTENYLITSLEYAATARPTTYTRTCRAGYGQACYHYSSAISVSPQWSALTCPPEAATTARPRLRENVLTKVWSKEHKGKGWENPNPHPTRTWSPCARDEYPPYYLLGPKDPAMVNGGNPNKPGGQLMRFIVAEENSGAASMWSRMCFEPLIDSLTDQQIINMVRLSPHNKKTVHNARNIDNIAKVTVDKRPVFVIGKWEQPYAADDGLWDNWCWPKAKTPFDPGYCLVNADPWYTAHGRTPAYKYYQNYDPSKGNGV